MNAPVINSATRLGGEAVDLPIPWEDFVQMNKAVSVKQIERGNPADMWVLDHEGLCQ